MKTEAKKLIATTLILSLFGLPGTLLAQGRRGANLVITLKDSSQIGGELIAVKPDSLVLVSPVGKDESVNIAEIRSITFARRSKAGSGFLIGFLAGAIGGGVVAYKTNPDDTYKTLGAAAGAVLFGGLAGLIGLGIGSAAGKDETVQVEGISDQAMDKVMADLRKAARIRSVP